jgi:tetratricopeptide (TPR) repeat protein
MSHYIGLIIIALVVAGCAAPGSSNSNPTSAEGYYNRGNACAAKGDHDCAIADYDQAIKLKPDFAEAYYNRGNDYAAKGDYDRAIADSKKYLELGHDAYWRQQAEKQLKELGVQ